MGEISIKESFSILSLWKLWSIKGKHLILSCTEQILIVQICLSIRCKTVFWVGDCKSNEQRVSPFTFSFCFFGLLFSGESLEWEKEKVGDLSTWEGVNKLIQVIVSSSGGNMQAITIIWGWKIRTSERSDICIQMMMMMSSAEYICAATCDHTRSN